MTTAPRPEFRLRHLLNPLYLVRRCRELGSPQGILRAAANVPRYVAGRCENAFYELRGLPGLLMARGEDAYYELRGLPGLLKARGRNAYYELRGLPGFARARAEDLYYNVDGPYYRSKLFWALNDDPRRPAAPTKPSAPRSFEAREPATLLRSGLRREETLLAERFQKAQPFKHVVIEGLLDPEFCAQLVEDFPPYDEDAFRNEHGHLGKAVHENVRELGSAYRKMDELARSPEFLRTVSAITGIPDLIHDPDYMGGGTHENLEEMELDPHVDFTVHKKTGLFRRVNILLYLNPEWDEAWGGGLEIHLNPWLPAHENRIQTIAPAFNRCVMFEASDYSWHGFRPIRLPKGKKHLTRRSFALYLYTRDKPKGFLAIPHDLTVFVDRPLPPEIRAGRRLTEEDVRKIKHLIVRRDWKLKYLYDRAIALYNECRQNKS